MEKAIIISASRGLGPELAQVSLEYNIRSETHFVSYPNVGEVSSLKTCNPDYFTDISLPLLPSVFDRDFNYLVWYTGVFLKKSFAETTESELDVLFDLHYKVPVKIIHQLHKQRKNSYHLIVIASCSSWRMRLHEAVYCSLCAAKSTFARTFANELSRDLIGSKVLLVNPGGLRTPFYYENNIEMDGYLDLENLARFIWKSAKQQEKSFMEIQYLRNKSSVSGDMNPIIELGAKLPETI